MLDFVADMETDVFHSLPHADRMSYRAVRNALIEPGEVAKIILENVWQRYPEVDW